MGSAGHRANILNADYRLLGAGARRSAKGAWYAAQVFGTFAEVDSFAVLPVTPGTD